ncbi:MAG: transposase [Parcubacteria group bacterium]|nr:transposase [Parcubacteria group bacterium]
MRQISFTLGNYYHLYNRGTDKRIIFEDEHDYRRFLALLYLCNNSEAVDMRDYFNKGSSFVNLFTTEKISTLVDIGAYCLMPNHFHILIYEKQHLGISTFMKKIATAYSMYFNRKHDRTGTLFEGSFKAKYVDNEPYFNWLFSYIHLNPIKIANPDWKEMGIANLAKTKSFLSNYHYSSYGDYFVKNRPESSILNKDSFPEHFKTLNDIGNLISEFNTNVIFTKEEPL